MPQMVPSRSSWRAPVASLVVAVLLAVLLVVFFGRMA
jgi:hypothetical protein